MEQAEQVDLAPCQHGGQGIVRQQLHRGPSPGWQMIGELVQLEVQPHPLGIPYPAIRLHRRGQSTIGIKLTGTHSGIQTAYPGRIELTRLAIEGHQCAGLLANMAQALLPKIGNDVHLFRHQCQQRAAGAGDTARLSCKLVMVPS